MNFKLKRCSQQSIHLYCGDVAEIDLLSRNEKDIVDIYSVINCTSCLSMVCHKLVKKYCQEVGGYQNQVICNM